MRLGGRFSALYRVALLSAISLSAACGTVSQQVYLHDASLKEKTDAVAEAFDALDNQADFFSAAQRAFADAGEQRRASRRERLDAIHNFGLAVLIADHDSNDPAHVRDRAADYVGRELGDIEPPDNLEDLVAALQTHERAVTYSTATMADRYRQYTSLLSRGEEARPGECNDETESIENAPGATLLHSRFVQECKNLLQNRALLAAARGTTFNSEYHDEAAELANAISIAEAARKNLKRNIILIRQEASAAQGVSDDDPAKKALKELELLLSRLDGIDPVPGSIAGIDLSKIKEPIDNRLVALAARAQAMGGELKTVLQAVSDPESKPESEQHKRAKDVYQYLLRTSSALKELEAATSRDLPAPLASLLMLEHYKQLERANARQISHYKHKLALLETQAAAEEARRRHLFEALRLTNNLKASCQRTGFAAYLDDCNDESRVARILIALDLAHTKGVVPTKMAGEKIVNLARTESLARSRANYDHVIAVAGSSIEVIEAYGDGGIKAETIAKLVNGLALLAIAVGVN